jgi:hypothetical protein
MARGTIFTVYTIVENPTLVSVGHHKIVVQDIMEFHFARIIEVPHLMRAIIAPFNYDMLTLRIFTGTGLVTEFAVHDGLRKEQ